MIASGRPWHGVRARWNALGVTETVAGDPNPNEGHTNVELARSMVCGPGGNAVCVVVAAPDVNPVDRTFPRATDPHCQHLIGGKEQLRDAVRLRIGAHPEFRRHRRYVPLPTGNRNGDATAVRWRRLRTAGLHVPIPQRLEVGDDVVALYQDLIGPDTHTVRVAQ